MRGRQSNIQLATINNRIHDLYFQLCIYCTSFIILNLFNHMDKQSELISQALSKVYKYTKSLKQNAGIQPIQSSQTVLSHDSNQYYEYPHAHTSSAAFHKSKSKKQSGILSREISPKNIKNKHKQKEKDPFNMSCKHPILKKEFQSENERDTVGFNRTENKVEIKHLGNLLNGSMGSKDFINKKSGHSYTYTHLNDADSDKFSEKDNSFYVKPQKLAKFRHSKSPSKQRYIEHNNTIYADENYNKISFANRNPGLPKAQNERQVNEVELDSLLKEIKRLEGIIEQYQAVLMKIKHKYLELEDKLEEKMLNDHYIDVLKKHIEDLQEKNSLLNVTIRTQRETIGKFENIFIEKVTLIRQHYQKRVEQNIALAKQSQYLKKILLIATAKPEAKTQPVQKTESASSPNIFLSTMAKSVQQFCNKWK